MGEARDIVGDSAGGALDTLATVSEGDSGGDPTSLPRGTAIHRYVLLEEIGAGAMGVVYAAYDYGLDRKVAVKLVRDPGRKAARRRLLREAQALAQLSHPNVVTVFDVGTYRDQVFVAMELVEGRTLRAWLGDAPREWREVVEVFRRAGDGLAAAHAAGIVHRDFKPDNVLIDPQSGRVRVGDFGLALIDRGEEATGSSGHGERTVDRASDQVGARRGVHATGSLDTRAAAEAAALDTLPAERDAEAVDAASAPRVTGALDTASAPRVSQVVDTPSAPHDIRALDTPPDRPTTAQRATVGATGSLSAPRPPPRAEPGSITATGLAVGTPAYMAPEQHGSWLPIDGRADQFAFCVALHEALTGQRPFGDESSPDLSDRIARGAVIDPPRDRALPSGLRRILRRGLAHDPRRRYPSMDALLTELDRELGARSRHMVVAAAAGATGLIAAAVLLASGSLGQRDAEPSCRGAAAKLTGVWDAARARAVSSAFRAASPRRADGALAQVVPALDRYAGDWVAMRTASCEATHVRGEQSEALLDLRTQCLDRRLAGLRALTELFLAPDPETVGRAIQAVDALEPLELCANAAALREVIPPPDPSVAARVDEMRGRLARARALTLTGKYDIALAQAVLLTDDARALAYQPMLADALQLLGRLQRQTGSLKEAEETLYAAAAAAEAGRNGDAAVNSWLELTWLVGETGARYPEAHRLAGLARGAIERMGGDEEHEGNLEDWVGVLYLDQGQLDQAQPHLERGLRLREKVHGAEHLNVAASLQHLAILEGSRGEQERALELHRRARQIAEKKLGTQHPDMIAFLSGEGSALYELGRHDEALVLFERGLAMVEKLAGPESDPAASFLVNIGLARWKKKDLAGAREAEERALAILEKLLGPDHPRVANTLVNLGLLLTDMKDSAGAAAHFERAVAAFERVHAGADHPDVASALDGLGRAHMRAGHAARAVPPLERALAIRLRVEGAPRDLAYTRYQLARALGHARPRPERRIRELLDAALAGFRRAGDDEAAAEVVAWLAVPGLKEPP